MLMMLILMSMTISGYNAKGCMLILLSLELIKNIYMYIHSLICPKSDRQPTKSPTISSQLQFHHHRHHHPSIRRLCHYWQQYRHDQFFICICIFFCRHFGLLSGQCLRHFVHRQVNVVELLKR